jgi:hypothetical protein
VAGLLYLQHAFRFLNEAVVTPWVENPLPALTGHCPPIAPRSLTRLCFGVQL